MKKFSPKHTQIPLSPEVKALKIMRELRDLSRAKACDLLKISYKHLVSFETGQIELNIKHLMYFISMYEFETEEFEMIKKGVVPKKEEPKKRSNTPPDKYYRRSYQKIITKQVKAIRSIRKKLGLSQYEASFKCGFSKGSFGQIENGRIELTGAKIDHILTSLGVPREEYKKELDSEKTSEEVFTECVSIFKKLNIEQLNTSLKFLKVLSEEEKFTTQTFQGGKVMYG